MDENGSQHRGDSPTLFEKCVSSLVPHIGLVKVERLGQRLNVPTQGRRVAQTGTKPFSLTAPGSDPQPGIEPGPHWWEADMLTARPPEHPLKQRRKATRKSPIDVLDGLQISCKRYVLPMQDKMAARALGHARSYGWHPKSCQLVITERWARTTTTQIPVDKRFQSLSPFFYKFILKNTCWAI